MSKRVLIFGAGPIGREYYDILSLENVSLEILTRSDKTKTLFSQDYNIKKYNEIANDISDSKIIVALDTKIYPKVLSNFNFKNCKIFIEKPAIHSSKDFNKINYLEKDNFVGVLLNRRFYKSNSYIKNFNTTNMPLRILINYHERINFLPNKFTDFYKKNWVKQNGIHVFDYVESIFGKLKIDEIKNEKSNKNFFCSSGSFGETPYYLNASFDSYSSFKIEIQYHDSSIHLFPIEKLIHKMTDRDIEINECNIRKPGFQDMISYILSNDFSKFESLENIKIIQRKLSKFDNARL